MFVCLQPTLIIKGLYSTVWGALFNNCYNCWCGIVIQCDEWLVVLWCLQLWITRIAAASREHGMKYPALMHNLTKVGRVGVTAPCHRSPLGSRSFDVLTANRLSSMQTSVQLNRRVISDLAVTEPRSFLSLAKLAQARQQEGFRAALGDGKEPPGVFSRVVCLQWRTGCWAVPLGCWDDPQSWAGRHSSLCFTVTSSI